ncbi:putative ribonuclease H domain-containing protein [Arabidopsis thaliana]
MGCIFSNRSTGFNRQISSIATHTRSPIMAEALAIRLAIKHASDRGFKKLFVASDSKLLIESINSESPLIKLHGILRDILILSSYFQFICFKFIPREQNREVDALAKLLINASNILFKKKNIIIKRSI